MNSDIRISVGFRGHRKIKKLKNRLGGDGVVALVNLWIGVAVSKPAGILDGWDVEDIALEACWEGDAQNFVEVLVELELVDLDESGLYSMHNWDKWQSWAIGAEARSEKARKAARTKWDKTTICSEHATSIQRASFEHADSNAPLPSSPLLSSPILIKDSASSDADDVKDEVNEKPKTEFYLSKKKKKLKGEVLKNFNLFWEAFDYRKGKAEAADSWLDIYQPEFFEKIMQGAHSEATARKDIVRNGQSPKWAQGWLAGRRWENETQSTDEWG